MHRGNKIALVIVAYNEERLITPTLTKVPALVDSIIVVDDASKDSTPKLVLDRKKIDNRIDLVQHPTNQGVGAAVISGYLRARDGAYDVSVVIGGDDQMPLEQMERLIDPIIDGNADYVKGNRFLEETNDIETMPRIRLIGNTIISLLTKIASGYYKIFDVVDGYTALSLRAIKTIDWSKAWKGYGYPMDFLIRLNAYGFRVMDVPRRAIYLPGERQSQIKGWSYLLRVSPMLFRDFLWRLKFRYIYRDFHPLVFLFMGGATSFLIGLGIGVWIVSSKITGTIPSAATSILCAMFVSLGIQSIFFAMLFEMMEEKGKK
jgi:glycosyltransferase involved in cell wall biosynthesis